MTKIKGGEINICIFSPKKNGYGVCMGNTIGIFLETFTRRNNKGEIIDKYTENYVVKFIGIIITHEILHREINREGLGGLIEEESIKEVTK